MGSASPHQSPTYVTPHAELAYLAAERQVLDKLPNDIYCWDRDAVCPSASRQRLKEMMPNVVSVMNDRLSESVGCGFATPFKQYLLISHLPSTSLPRRSSFGALRPKDLLFR